MNYDSWRTNEDPSWMKHDNADTNNIITAPPRAECILACGHCYCDYCKCNDFYVLESELSDYLWRNV